jgi:malonate-semialdehyde dehydrogenase (acetylating)/methylmalonate-semialdehyde dehydrogenase
MTRVLENYINGNFVASRAAEHFQVHNPATGDVLALTPLSSTNEVAACVEAAHTAQREWRQVPPTERVQYLFALKALLEEHLDELSGLITDENGKTLAEARGEMQRAIENVEVACGIPTMMQGYISEDIARGIDELMIRQPLGVAAIIAPFNFPGMIPFWFLPYALATGNAVVVKPSERCPLTMQRVFELLEGLDLPPGVANMLHGGPEAVNALLDHPLVRAVSFVGSTPVARHIYSRAAVSGKRVQAQGGAKNPVVIMPDADVDMTTRILADSAFGNAGQRCLAASLAITVGEAGRLFRQPLLEAADSRVVGYGAEEGVTMGPVISPQSKDNIERLIQAGLDEGAEALVDGRGLVVKGHERGNFLRPTILSDVTPGGTVFSTEIFGPVLGLLQVDSLEAAIKIVNQGAYGNMACIFTSSGAAARKFRHEADAGNVGVNIGVAAPMAFFPFSGWKDSFFGTLHGQSGHAVEFFTQTKVVVERWPREWSRTF